MSKLLSVLLPGSEDRQFRRTMRDEEGKPMLGEDGKPRVLTFRGGEVVELTPEEVEAVRTDIGPALKLAAVKTIKGDGDKPSQTIALAKVDTEATERFVEQTQKLAERRTAAKVKAKQAAKKDLEAK